MLGVRLVEPRLAHAQEPSPPPTEAPAPSEPPPEVLPAPPPEPPPTEASTSADAPESTGTQEAAGGWGDLSAFEEEAEESTPVFRAKLYGFIDSYWEKTGRTPESIGDDGKTEYEKNPYEFDVLNLHVMVQGALYDKYRFFVNLAAPGSGSPTEDSFVQVRNAWVEAPIWGRYLNARVGKTYRRFGLYNEILDAVPTFIGIEPPEIFDRDHLMLTRTTNLMLHGSVDAGPGVFNYSLTTGNDERKSGAVPVGGDLNLEFPIGLKFGSSFYFSGGGATPSRAVGDGSPIGGVVNWMRQDTYRVLGGYAQLRNSGWILQAEYWRGHHDARRDADAVATLLADGSLFPSQARRFVVDGDAAMIRTKVVYDIDAFYFRGAYEFSLGKLASLTPYVQYDYYRNPETVKAKSLGGDNEAGASEDGQFSKYTLGGVFRPVPQVALKVDSSVHNYKFNGEHVFYPEIRASFSYLWELAQ
ncbi:MAG TPA: hypothetical protein VI299_13495 [Polyangiales bacterium]